MHQRLRDSTAGHLLFTISQRAKYREICHRTSICQRGIVNYVQTARINHLFSPILIGLRGAAVRFPPSVCIEYVFQTAPFSAKYATRMWVIPSFRNHTLSLSSYSSSSLLLPFVSFSKVVSGQNFSINHFINREQNRGNVFNIFYFQMLMFICVIKMRILI